MCGRFYVDPDDSDKLKKFIQKANLRESCVRKHYTATEGEVAPGNMSVALAPNKNKVIEPFLMNFGYVYGSMKKLIINARFETASEKKLFSESYKFRRCVIPVSFFFEWKSDKDESIKYIYRTDNKIIYLCGLYFIEMPQKFPSFVILTKEARPDLCEIHSRMPVMVSENNVERWIDGVNCGFDFSDDFEAQSIRFEEA